MRVASSKSRCFGGGGGSIRIACQGLRVGELPAASANPAKRLGFQHSPGHFTCSPPAPFEVPVNALDSHEINNSPGVAIQGWVGVVPPASPNEESILMTVKAPPRSRTMQSPSACPANHRGRTFPCLPGEIPIQVPPLPPGYSRIRSSQLPPSRNHRPWAHRRPPDSA